MGSSRCGGPAQSCPKDCSSLSLGLSFPMCTVWGCGLRQGLGNLPWVEVPEFGRDSLTSLALSWWGSQASP